MKTLTAFSRTLAGSPIFSECNRANPKIEILGERRRARFCLGHDYLLFLKYHKILKLMKSSSNSADFGTKIPRFRMKVNGDAKAR